MSKILFKLLLFCLLMILGSQSCVVATKETAIVPQIRSLFDGTYKTDPYMAEHRPVTVAVLPFIDKSRKKEGADAVRKGFYNHFSSLPFRDLEIRRIDNLLAKANLADTEAVFKTSPQDWPARK